MPVILMMLRVDGKITLQSILREGNGKEWSGFFLISQERDQRPGFCKRGAKITSSYYLSKDAVPTICFATK
jgi:hypothetical protein